MLISELICKGIYFAAATFFVAIFAQITALDRSAQAFLIGSSVAVDISRAVIRTRGKRRQVVLDPRDSIMKLSPLAIVTSLAIVFGGSFVVVNTDMELIGPHSQLLQERLADMMRYNEEIARNAYLIDSFGLSLAFLLIPYFSLAAAIRGDRTHLIKAEFLEWRQRLWLWLAVFAALIVLAMLGYSALGLGPRSGPPFVVDVWLFLALMPAFLVGAWVKSYQFIEAFLQSQTGN